MVLQVSKFSTYTSINKKNKPPTKGSLFKTNNVKQKTNYYY